jgi:hydrogenase nickel incorporation protein HypB
MDLDAVDLAFLENVGNLICPAEYDTGAAKNVMILSVPEGDDKPLKYPLMFQTSDVLVITKTDTLPYFRFDLEKCMERVKKTEPRNPYLCGKRKDRRWHEGMGGMAERTDCAWKS